MSGVKDINNYVNKIEYNLGEVLNWKLKQSKLNTGIILKDILAIEPKTED